MQHEDEASLVPVLELPRAGVGDGLVGVLVGEVVDLVVRHVDRQPVLPGVLGQSPWHGPRPEHAVLLEPKVGMTTRTTVVMQHEPACPTPGASLTATAWQYREQKRRRRGRVPDGLAAGSAPVAPSGRVCA